MLLDKGAKHDAQDRWKHTALDWAKTHEHHAIVRLIERHIKKLKLREEL